MLLDLS
jgi:hypothetical protein